MKENSQTYRGRKLAIDGIRCQIQDRTVAPYIKDCIIIIGVNIRELFSGRELVFDDRVLKELGHVVLEGLEAMVTLIMWLITI
jgi:hypothetical protein